MCVFDTVRTIGVIRILNRTPRVGVGSKHSVFILLVNTQLQIHRTCQSCYGNAIWCVNSAILKFIKILQTWVLGWLKSNKNWQNYNFLKLKLIFAMLVLCMKHAKCSRPAGNTSYLMSVWRFIIIWISALVVSGFSSVIHCSLTSHFFGAVTLSCMT